MTSNKFNKLKAIARLIRYWSLKMTTKAGSGHPTSGMSATDLMTVLFFNGYYHYDLEDPDSLANDRVVFSKGHATPLFYGLYAAAGAISEEELMRYRDLDSNLEGHPTFRFKYTEAATGSLGQGLAIGLGLAMGQRKIGKMSQTKAESANGQMFPRTYVLLGDGEMAEGSSWEAVEVAGYYEVGNLVAVLDVNRLGQSQETMVGHDVELYRKRVEPFGWHTVVLPDGHDLDAIDDAYQEALQEKSKPSMIIAKTLKGKGVPFLEDENGWHGKPLAEDELDRAVEELGVIDLSVRGEIKRSQYALKSNVKSQMSKVGLTPPDYSDVKKLPTRKAYGRALARIGKVYPQIVSLDGDVKNSTYSQTFMQEFPERFFEMFIAEQNMAGVALGMQRLGLIPFASTFSAFWSRAFDQIRMSVLSKPNIKFIGSHAGVSIGQDGPSQMGLEDLAMFRTIHGSKVVYPADPIATEKLVEEMVEDDGIVYMRTTRAASPIIYDYREEFSFGGFKLHQPEDGRENVEAVVVAAGITLHEALKSQEQLADEGIAVLVIDCYSVKPINEEKMRATVGDLPVVVVEDHWFEGGLGDAVLNVFADRPKVKIHKLAVRKIPHSGTPQENLAAAGIDAAAITAQVRSIVGK